MYRRPSKSRERAPHEGGGARSQPSPLGRGAADVTLGGSEINRGGEDTHACSVLSNHEREDGDEADHRANHALAPRDGDARPPLAKKALF